MSGELTEAGSGTFGNPVLIGRCWAWLTFSVFLAFGQDVSQDVLEQARSLLSQGDFNGAKEAALGYLRGNEKSADTHFLLGYILFKQKDPKGSLAQYTEGAKYRKPSAAELQVVASDYVLLGDYTDADRWFTKALEWSPNDSLGWYYLGRVKYNENRFAEAIEAFDRCLALDPKNVKAEDNRGLAYQGLGRNEDAIASYERALKWQNDPATKDSGPYLDLGSLLADDGRVSEAMPYLLEAARISPEDFRTHRQLGKARLRLGQLEGAQTELLRAIEIAPSEASLHVMLAQVYQKRGLHAKAKEETERYAELSRVTK